MLNARELKVFYGVIQGLKGVDIDVYDREIVTLIGSNGAGKTSTLNGIVNLVRSSGRVSFLNDDISRSQTHQIVRRGLALVPEGRRVFTNLTIEENLRMGAYNNLAGYARLRDRMYALFPRLKERRHQMAGTMSGGEQQMLAIARALMSEPVLLMLDEPSLGLAPKIVGELFGIIKQLREENMTVLLVEQNATAALAIADRAYVLENGRITLSGAAREMLTNPEIKRMYLGVRHGQNCLGCSGASCEAATSGSLLLHKAHLVPVGFSRPASLSMSYHDGTTGFPRCQCPRRRGWLPAGSPP